MCVCVWLRGGDLITDYYYGRERLNRRWGWCLTRGLFDRLIHTPTQTQTQADAFIAAKCLNEDYDAVISSDSDFLALDCPWIPLRVGNERSGCIVWFHVYES